MPLACAAILFFFFGVGVFDHDLWAPTEPALAGGVWEMYTQGDLAAPKINGYTYFEKPPLSYWCALACCALRGKVDAGLIRLPSALAGFFGVALVYWAVRRRYGASTACLSTLMCATGLFFGELAHRAGSDMLASFFAMACLALFTASFDRTDGRLARNLRLDVGFAAVLALSFYSKNFYTYLVVLPPVFLFLLWRRRWGRVILLGAMVFLFSAIFIAPWAWALYRSGGWDYLRIVFVDNTIGRFFTIKNLCEINIGPLNDAYFAEKHKHLLFYGEAWFYLTLPWIVPHIAAPIAFFRKRPADDFRSFVKLAFLVIPVVLTFSSSRVLEYLAPLFFFMLIMAADYFDDLIALRREPWKWEAKALLANVVIVILLLLALPVVAGVLRKNWALWLWSVPLVAGLYWIVRLRGVHGFSYRGLSLFFLWAVFAYIACFGSMIPYVDDQKAHHYFFDEVRLASHGRAVYTTYCDDRRMPLITFYMNRRISVLEPNPQTVIRALSAGNSAVIASPEFYRDRLSSLLTMDHTVIPTRRGRNVFVWIGIP